MAEWLRRGLQILAPRFDSGRGLQILFLPSTNETLGVGRFRSRRLHCADFAGRARRITRRRLFAAPAFDMHFRKPAALILLLDHPATTAYGEGGPVVAFEEKPEV